MTSTQQPLRCTRCGDEDGPFVPEAGLCEDCERLVPGDGAA